ncbi:hypothetical protein QTO34_013767 [Cnephaeus nilssonii]|uniref:Uncharacterized protein n=1 Tax=Cnephaeus nilssonii TaxID=3371016 RepID=A0AA40LVB0_CNENI|nr:hypothetical protein QTO34_013767 [Eptesicus nilssonii]
MKKKRKEEVNGLQNQIANSGLTGELDASKSQDLSKIMMNIQAQYDELTRKNREELDKTVLLPIHSLLLQLEAELAWTQAEGQYQAQEYQALLKTKVKLENEISTYCLLLEEGKDFDFGDNVDHSNSMQSIQMVTSCMMVDGKVVSEGHPLGQ